MIATSYDLARTTPRPQRPALMHDALHWLVIALLIVIIASWYFGLSKTASSGAGAGSVHPVSISCGGVATPC